jgi:hypothetical protein
MATEPNYGTPMRGTIQKVEFTSGGAGNQYTTIDGIVYATWWNFDTKDWKTGDVVTFYSYKRPLWSGQSSVVCAQGIKKAED